MKTRAILTTVVAFVLLVAVVAAGLNAVFTVTLVDSEFSLYSDTGRAEAEELKAELDGFVGKSTTFLDLSKVRSTVEKYPCFRVESVGKKFPKTVEVKVSERKEFYAFENGEGFSVLDEDGVYLYDGENNENRLGGMNVVLKGFEPTLVKGERATGAYMDEAYAMFAEFAALLPGLRANIVSLSLENGGGHDTPEHMLFVVTMREGVKIVIRNPSEGIAVKARAAFLDEGAGYLSLSDKRRMYGAINVSNLTEDGTSANVSFFDEPPISVS